MNTSLLVRDSRVFLGENISLYTIPEGWNSVTVGTPIEDPTNGLSSIPDAVTGLICVWGGYSGLSSVTVNSDVSFSFIETVYGAGGTFRYYFIDPLTGDVGEFGLVTILPEVGGSTPQEQSSLLRVKVRLGIALDLHYDLKLPLRG